MPHLIEVMENSIGEFQDSLLELQLSKRYTYENYKIIEVMPKITQDEVTSDFNFSTNLNGIIEVQETKVEEALIIIKDNEIDLTS